ncbi:outer membrane beta-barrel protein [Flavobacterium sp. PLA-1-15]|uniref:outer membrane beta-barrel protein n=1 Tax=Flavobacterium sp. PLA-1-15 TaxID=3380533 RepID=UPI003B821291
MKNSICLLAILLLSTFNLFAQNDYRKGYYVDKDNNKAEVYLQYKDYSKLNQPENKDQSIKFKTSLEGKTQEISQDKVKELSIADEFKLQRFFIPVLKNYGNKPLHEVQNKNLLLQVLVEGEGSLYAYQEKKKTIYFYKLANQSFPVELTHDVKTYGGEVVNTNSGYRKELYTVLKTEQLQPSDFAKIKYNDNDLIEIFNKYNKEIGKKDVTFKNEFSKSKMVFTGFVNFNNASVVVGNAFSNSNKKSMFGIGVGAEAELRTSKKWAFFLRASFQTSKYTLKTNPATKSSATFVSTFDVDSKAIDVVVSPRYYVNISKANNLFFNLGLGLSIQSGSVTEVLNTKYITTVYDREPVSVSFKTAISINPAIGYSFNDKFSIELQYRTIKDYFQSSDEGTAVTAGYKSFTVKNNQTTLGLRYSFN